MFLPELKSWVLKSVSIGTGPDVIKELDVQQFISIFQGDLPVFILAMKFDGEYREINDFARHQLDNAFEDI
jgi:hypothetical protein